MKNSPAKHLDGSRNSVNKMDTLVLLQRIVALLSLFFLVNVLKRILATCWAEAPGQPQKRFASANSPGNASPLHATPRKQAMANRNMERELIQRIRSTPKDKLNRYKRNAAMRLQANLIRSFQTLANSPKEIPPKVRTMAKSAVAACQGGHMTAPIINNLPTILQQSSPQKGHPAEQLQTMLATLIPNVPGAVKGNLQGLLNFVSTNLTGVNTLLARVLGGAPDLLSGVIKSLTNNLGAVTESLNGSLGSLGVLLGGALG